MSIMKNLKRMQKSTTITRNAHSLVEQQCPLLVFVYEYLKVFFLSH